MKLQNCDEITKKIFIQIANYDLLEYFDKREEIFEWIKSLDKLEINNFLILNIDPEKIKFDKSILIDKNLLKTNDYLKRVEKIVSIDNATSWYHLFKNLITKDFLESKRFYTDIEKLKKAYSAQIPLWIIGNKTFINSPYHDEDFDMLIDKINKTNEKYDDIAASAIANLASCELSIYSGHHQNDMKEVYNSSSSILQSTYNYPKKSINNLAKNKESLKDKYHEENMKILKNHPEISNFLYAVMTNENIIKSKDYRKIIKEMINHKNNKKYVFLICCYSIGIENAKLSLTLDQQTYIYELGGRAAIEDKMPKVYQDINTINNQYIENNSHLIEESKPKTFFKRLFKK